MPCQLPGSFQLTSNILKPSPHFLCNGISYGYFDLDAHLITPTDASPFDTSEDCALHLHHHPLLVQWQIRGHGHGMRWPQHSICFLIILSYSISLRTPFMWTMVFIQPLDDSSCARWFAATAPFAFIKLRLFVMDKRFCYATPFFGIAHNWNDAPGPVSNLYTGFTPFLSAWIANSYTLFCEEW
jgi:hypothetical protein